MIKEKKTPIATLRKAGNAAFKQFLNDVGAVEVEDDYRGGYSHSVMTSCGKLFLSYDEVEDYGAGHIFDSFHSKFENPELAKDKFYEANPHSGKWNFYNVDFAFLTEAVKTR